MKKIYASLKRCKFFFKNCHKELVIILILGFITPLIASILPSLGGKTINQILGKNFKLVIIFAIFFVFLQILYTLLNLFISKKFLSLKRKIDHNIQKEIFQAILNLDIDIYSIYGKGSIINKVRNDSKNVLMFLENIKDSFFNIITYIFILIYIFYLNGIIGLCHLLCIIIILLFQYYGIKKSAMYKEKLLDEQDKNTSLIGEIVSGAKDIKTLNVKNKFLDTATESFDKIGEYDYKSNIFARYTKNLSEFMCAILSGIILIIAVFLIKYNLLETSTFIIILMYRNKIFTFTSKFSTTFDNYKKFDLSLNRILSIIDYQKEKFGNKYLKNYSGEITLKNVSFSYKNKPIFENLNLKINPNSFTILAGPNGAGKSTIFSLLTKILVPTKGTIYLDNENISELSEQSIRDSISLLTQQPHLFNLSIKDNLLMVNDDVNRIKKVCEIVGLDKKIESLEDGYNTVICEDGTNLSGGEKQKLAIARSLLIGSKVLLLDEITNNLDSKTVNSILELIKKLKSNYTIVMITHSLELMHNADRIILLQDGRVVGDDNHDMLIKKNKYYQKIYQESRLNK